MLLRTLAAIAIVAGTASAAARADGLPSKIDVRADTVAFHAWANEPLLAATGHVIVRENGRTIAADAVRIDLRKNRLLASGAVRIAARDAAYAADAYALDLVNDTAFAMRAEPLPATFAVRGIDFAHAVEGPAPPGTFDALDLDGQRPFMRSHHAIVMPNAALRMTPAEFPTGAGPALSLPTYLYTLVQNGRIVASAAPAASFDQPYSLFGSSASLTDAHVRYDAQNGVTFGIDNRLIDGNKAYVVTSFLPLRDRQIDLLSFQQLRPGLQQQISGFATFGAFPADFVQYQLQHSGKLLKETLLADQFDADNTAQVTVTTYEHDVGHYFGYELHAGYGYDHVPGAFPFANVFRTDIGALALAPDVTLLRTSLTAQYAYNVRTYDFPHELTTGTLTLTAGRPVSSSVRVLASASFAQIDNRYRDPAIAARALGLPNPALPYLAPDGTPYPGYFAYAGLATERTYALQATIRNRHPDDQVTLALTHTDDFPQFHGFGRPPLVASIDVTRRITPTLRIELGRSYAFGWAGQYLSPQYTLGISP